MRANVDPSFVLSEAEEHADAEMADADEDEKDAADDPMIISSDAEESGALDQFVKITKPRPDDLATQLPTKGEKGIRLPLLFSAPVDIDVSISQQREILTENTRAVGQKD